MQVSILGQEVILGGEDLIRDRPSIVCFPIEHSFTLVIQFKVRQFHFFLFRIEFLPIKSAELGLIHNESDRVEPDLILIEPLTEFLREVVGTINDRLLSVDDSRLK